MSWRHYDEARALACDAERAAPDEHLVPVRQLLAAELATMPVRRVVDVGTGTELWSDRLVRWLSAPVIAVEPSAPMIAVLVSKNVAGVALVQARGEALPLRDGSCGCRVAVHGGSHVFDAERGDGSICPRRPAPPRSSHSERGRFADAARFSARGGAQGGSFASGRLNCLLQMSSRFRANERGDPRNAVVAGAGRPEDG